MKNIFKISIFLFILVNLAFCNELELKVDTDYRTGAGDVLEVLIALPNYEEEMLQNTQTNEKFAGADYSKTVAKVDPNGTILLPLIGKINVKNLTSVQIKNLIAKKLDKYIINPEVTINILEYANYSIFVFGEVKNSGMYNPKKEITVLEIIALAGGFTKYAARSNIKIFRYEYGEHKVIKININKLTKNNDMKNNIILKSGDTIFIPQRSL